MAEMLGRGVLSLQQSLKFRFSHIFKENNQAVKFLTGMSAPTSNLTLVLIDSTQLCFIWEHEGQGQKWNFYKVELEQNGTNKGTIERDPNLVILLYFSFQNSRKQKLLKK